MTMIICKSWDDQVVQSVLRSNETQWLDLIYGKDAGPEAMTGEKWVSPL